MKFLRSLVDLRIRSQIHMFLQDRVLILDIWQSIDKVMIYVIHCIAHECAQYKILYIV
jgi:hypothetical protein